MNPILKIVLSNFGGALAVGIDAAIQAAAHPTGGLAAALGNNASYAALYAVGLNAAHVFIDQLEAKLGIHPAQTQ